MTITFVIQTHPLVVRIVILCPYYIAVTCAIQNSSLLSASKPQLPSPSMMIPMLQDQMMKLLNYPNESQL